MDFSPVKAEGWYTLEVDGKKSRPFPYRKGRLYPGRMENTELFPFSERCGFDVPGIHTECHMDVMSVHPDGRRLPVCGGGMTRAI